jgi:hypothetical protein
MRFLLRQKDLIWWIIRRLNANCHHIRCVHCILLKHKIWFRRLLLCIRVLTRLVWLQPWYCKPSLVKLRRSFSPVLLLWGVLATWLLIRQLQFLVWCNTVISVAWVLTITTFVHRVIILITILFNFRQT